MQRADAGEDIATIMRRPIIFAVLSGAVLLGATIVLVRLGRIVAGALIGGVPAALILLLCLSQIIGFSPSAIARLRGATEHLGGRFANWKAGAGGYSGVPFTHGLARDRFGVLNATTHGLPIEIGHLQTEVGAQGTLPMRKMTAYAAYRLPDRLPHMAIDFGHVSRFLGIRLAPVMWHRSQRVDVRGGRRFRLFVAVGGREFARAFFTSRTVDLFRQIGRCFDVEVKGDVLYLFATRSIAAPTERSWRRKSALIDELAASLADPAVWDLARHQHSGRGSARDTLQMDEKRTAIIVVAVAVAAFVILSTLAIYAWSQGRLNV